jgi:peptidoglycan hydrolase CwlO-like protein
VAELSDCTAALTKTRAKAVDLFGDVDSQNKNIRHHREMLEAYARGLGEVLQEVRAGTATKAAAEDVMKSANMSIVALNKAEDALDKLEKAAAVVYKELETLDTRIGGFVSKNKQDPEVADLTKLRRKISQLQGQMSTEILEGYEAGFKAAKPIKRYEDALADYLKLSGAAAAEQAKVAALRDRLPMLFNDRHIVVRKAEMDKAVASASTALDEVGDALSASKAGLMSRPPIIAVASIDADLATAQRALATIKAIFTEYGTGMADLARNQNEQKAFMASKQGKQAAAILKAGHDAQTDLAPRIKTLRKTETDLKAVAQKMRASQEAQKAERKAEAASKAAQLAAAKDAGKN